PQGALVYRRDWTTSSEVTENYHRNCPGFGPPIFAIIRWNLPIFFIICCIWLKRLSNVFSSVTVTPLPLAIRCRRRGFRICGLCCCRGVSARLLPCVCWVSLSLLARSGLFALSDA